MTDNFAIGLSGFAGSGKTTAALYLEQAYGFKRLHIAETLREMLAVLMRNNNISQEMIERYLVGDLKDDVIIPELGVTSRHLQITLGTEWGRDHVGPNVWADTWARMAETYPRVMNDSVRFPNEEDKIRDMGGITIMIERPGFGPAKFVSSWGKWLYKVTGSTALAHPSERVDRLDPDFTVDNDLGFAEMYAQLDSIMELYDIKPSEMKTDETVRDEF